MRLKVNSIAEDTKLEVLTGAGNTGFLITDSAIVVIDTKMGKMGRELADKAIETAGGRKIIVINTHFHGDHSFGNRNFKHCAIYTGGYDTAFARQNFKPEDFPTVFIKDSLILNLGDETLEMYTLGQGHTFADLAVYLQKREILFAGDLVFNRIHPALIRDDGTDLGSWISILEKIPHRWEISKIIPGHGDPGGIELIHEMKQYFTDMQYAASHPDSIKVIKSRYQDWMRMPFMASAKKTVCFIKGE